MTLSAPSSLAAATSASIPPKSVAEAAVAALLLSLPPEPSPEPQAASVMAAGNAATALKVVRNRTDVLQVEDPVLRTPAGPQAHGRPHCCRSRTVCACPA